MPNGLWVGGRAGTGIYSVTRPTHPVTVLPMVGGGRGRYDARGAAALQNGKDRRPSAEHTRETGMVARNTRTENRQREIIPGLEDVLSPAFPPAIKFEVMNKPQTVRVTGAKVVQARDYNDNSLRFWPSGDPMMILVLIVADANGEDRSLWIQGTDLTKKFRVALLDAGLKGIAIGDTVTVDWTGEEAVFDKKGKELKDPRKLYDVTITPV